MKNYWFYYHPAFYFVNQNIKGFDFIGLDYYSYFLLKLRVYSPQKTKIPAIAVTFVLFGFGFVFHSHEKR